MDEANILISPTHFISHDQCHFPSLSNKSAWPLFQHSHLKEVIAFQLSSATVPLKLPTTPLESSINVYMLHAFRIDFPNNEQRRRFSV